MNARVQNHPVGRCRYGELTSSSPKLGRQLHWLNCNLRLVKPNEILVVKNDFFPKEVGTTLVVKLFFMKIMDIRWEGLPLRRDRSAQLRKPACQSTALDLPSQHQLCANQPLKTGFVCGLWTGGESVSPLTLSPLPHWIQVWGSTLFI